MSVYAEHELFNASGAVSGTVRALDWRGGNGASFERAIAGTLTSGDTIDVEVSLDNSTFVSVLTFTSTTFAGVFNGPWKFVRVTKTGANGAAVVKMIG